MIRMTFQSGLKEKEKQFVAFKQQFGYTYEARIYNLLDFDRFCAANYPGRDTLDRDIVLKWAVIRPTETANGFATRISAVRQFGKYLVMLGEDAYIIPDGFRGGDMPLMPYIFSEATLRQFLGYTDSMVPEAVQVRCFGSAPLYSGMIPAVLEEVLLCPVRVAYPVPVNK